MSNKTLIETVGTVNPERQDYVAVSIPSFRQPLAMYQILLTDIPSELIAPMMKSGTQLLARVQFLPDEEGAQEVESITDLELVPAS